MPRPVLSETTFNADNIATAILQQANLQITNSQLGVTDITSEFVRQTGWSQQEDSHCYLFNGFVFFYLNAIKESVPSNNEVIWIIGTDYRPEDTYQAPFITYQGDTGNTIYFYSDGNVKISHPISNLADSSGQTSFRVVINGWYRI
jgi:predicted methyltransferase